MAFIHSFEEEVVAGKDFICDTFTIKFVNEGYKIPVFYINLVYEITNYIRNFKLNIVKLSKFLILNMIKYFYMQATF